MIVDLHTHVLSAALPDMAAETGEPRFARVVPETDGPQVGEVRQGDKVFRVVQRPFWDPAARIEEMDGYGVDVQVISPIPVAITYWAEPEQALRFARAQNEEIAAQVAGSNGRLRGLGTVPLQDPARAAAELKNVLALGLDGVEIGSVVDGRELDHPSLRPFFATAADLGVPIFVHPIDGSGVLRCSSPLTDFALGMHADGALAATALVYGGVLAEFGELRVCLSHGGGSFPWTHPRLRLMRAKERSQLDDLVARLWADCLVFDALHLPLLIQRYGAGHVVLGSDYPFIPPAMHDPREPIAEAVAASTVSQGEASRILGPNALDFLAH